MRLINNIPGHKDGDKCPSCKDGVFRLIKSQFTNKKGKNKYFLGCSNYPNCKYNVPSYLTAQPITS